MQNAGFEVIVNNHYSPYVAGGHILGILAKTGQFTLAGEFPYDPAELHVDPNSFVQRMAQKGVHLNRIEDLGPTREFLISPWMNAGTATFKQEVDFSDFARGPECFTIQSIFDGELVANMEPEDHLDAFLAGLQKRGRRHKERRAQQRSENEQQQPGELIELGNTGASQAGIA